MAEPVPEKPLPLWCSLVAFAGCVAMIAIGIAWILEQKVIGRSGGVPVLQGTGATIAGVSVIGLAVTFILVTVRQYLQHRNGSDISRDDDLANPDG